MPDSLSGPFMKGTYLNGSPTEVITVNVVVQLMAREKES